MLKTAVMANGSVQLGEDAYRLGFRPGTPVDVIVTRAGTLIVVIDDTPALDVKFSALVGGAAQAVQRALRKGSHSAGPPAGNTTGDGETVVATSAGHNRLSTASCVQNATTTPHARRSA